MSEELVIERRFRGPRESANGGYACGLLAAAFRPLGPAEVTLHAPPPLDRPLTRSRVDGGAELRDGEALVAAGEPLDRFELELVDPVAIDAAEAACRRSPMREQHPYSECFVCGPDRDPGDGLRVTAGPVEGRDVVAAPFAPGPSLPRSDGSIAPETVWSVLDCPSGIAVMLLQDSGRSLLGRMAARLLAPVEMGRTYVAVGWPVAREGRKLDAASALYDDRGEPVAYARARWIEVRG